MGVNLAESLSAKSRLRGRDAGERKLIAVARFDLVRYSRLAGLDDADSIAGLQTLRRLALDPAVDEHGTSIEQSAGDPLQIVFDSTNGASRAGSSVHWHVPHRDGDVSPARRYRFRVGINLATSSRPVRTLMGMGSS